MKQPDFMDVGTQMDVARHRLLVAKEDLETAELIFGAGQYRGANNRAYYSIFHSISAVIAVEGVAFKRHKDTLSYFNKNYVRTEIFPRELGRKIVKAEEIRHASDYDTFYIASKEVTEQQIKTAKQILNLAEIFLEENVRQE
ncbi:MAG: HEPN domain-containing protein [Clostridiales bacterium]|nr:HEPN domain-containing protein [Clostridiales bacterium]